MRTEVQDAELEVARTKQRFEQSLRLASQTGSRLAAEIQRKATPALIVAVVVGGAVMAGGAIVVARGDRRGRGSGSSRPSAGRTLARTVGVWLLRAAALRLAEALAAKFLDSRSPELAAKCEPP